ncbi:MAG: TonB family protein [Daejeonella sp.]|uniref:M56 family metallopeptidase n=1 Tax=Daejeonella sp. TaxID=2805397 RepID=UPI002733DC70|nr:M56 family metallopeptidase [Daejeonella sp.]MDP3468770.1 TonB family protein [Daejeonella sp.]
MNILNYLLQTNLYLILFMGFYTLVLKNETFFRQNRIYLNTSTFLSFIIPFINSNWFQGLFITQKLRETIVPTQMIYEIVVVGEDEGTNNWAIGDIILWVYSGVMAILLFRFLIRMVLLNSKLKPKKGAAYSFFNTMVVDRELPESGIIIDHEKVHMREWHSADVLFIELASIINWFNPVVYLYKKEIRHIHEFIADEEAASGMPSKSDYALLLFSNTLGIQPDQLSNNFFNNSLLKKRIIMLNKNKSRRTGLWKYGFSAPLFALMLIFSAASVANENTDLIAGAEKLFSPSIASKYLPTVTIPADKTIDKKSSLENKVKQINSSTKSTQEDFSKLFKHLMRNMRYPASARQEKITGYEVVYFKIQNGKISNIKIAKGLQNDINNEVLRTFDLFKETVEAEDNDYALAIAFHLTGIESNPVLLPSTGKNYFIGSISVSAMGASEKVETSGPDYALSPVIIKDFASVDALPEFPGGIKGWGEYLQSTLKYPDQARKNKIMGRVILKFVVLKNGSITDIRVLRGIGGGADEEAIRVVQESPKWKPGMSNGEAVNVAYTMPIFFQLPSAAPEEKTN